MADAPADALDDALDDAGNRRRVAALQASAKDRAEHAHVAAQPALALAEALPPTPPPN